MNKILKASANGIAYLYSGMVTAVFVATGLLALTTIVTVVAGITGVIK